MSIFFISDLHLSSDRVDITQHFERFLSSTAQHAEALYILGDLFNAWIGDDDDSSIATRVTEMLKHTSETGTQLYLMPGNRDFLLGQRFADATKATLLEDPSVHEFDSQPVLLMHGDSLCTGDAEYMAFRQRARNPEWQHDVLSKTLEERRQIAQQLREYSASANAMKANDIMDVTQSEVIQQMNQHRVSRLIHGHTHRPKRHTLRTDQGDSERLVLGAWDDDMCYVEYVNREFKLKKQRL